MTYMIIGKQCTGKSAYYEGLLEQEKNRIYFATLWESDDTHAVILRHQQRRDASWVMRYSSGDIPTDMCLLDFLVSSIELPSYCMIDGLTNWYIHCADANGGIGIAASYLASSLSVLLGKHTEINWFLLDNQQSDYLHAPTIAAAWSVFHETMARKCSFMKKISWEGVI